MAQQPSHGRRRKQRPAGISASGPLLPRLDQRSLCYRALAGVTATAFFVEPLEHAAGVSSGRGNGASQEGQGNEG